MGEQSERRALILDLDFTLLHLEAVDGAIEVPGRTRSAFIAPATVEVLRAVSQSFDVILATARSWDGTHWVSDGLRQRGVPIAAAILEDGALIHLPPGGSAPEGPQLPAKALALEAERDWPALRQELESRRGSWPDFEWQRDFSACLVARAESKEQAARLAQAWQGILGEWNQAGRALRSFRDGRKVYVAGARADKWAALKSLLGERAEQAAGVGDGANDVCWMERIALPCTMPHAVPQVLALVQERRGFVARQDGHAGILEALRFLESAVEP